MKIEIVPATQAHIPAIIASSRGRERAAYEQIGSRSVEVLAQYIGNAAEAWAGLIDDKLVCVWGIDRGTLLTDSAFLWLISMEEVEEHPFTFVRHSQMRVAELRQRYGYLYGMVAADNKRSERWLRWLGFRIGDTELVSGYSLKRFSMVS